jgi:hypothetical protein
MYQYSIRTAGDKSFVKDYLGRPGLDFMRKAG